MSRIYLILSKYFEDHNMFNVMEFIRDSKIQLLKFVKSTTLSLDLHNNLIGGDIENVTIKVNGNKYLIQKDEYEDMGGDNRLIIDLIKIKAKPDSNGDFYKNDNCAILIIDKSNKTGAIQSLANYTDCLKCIDKIHPFKVGDVLIRIIIILAHRNGLVKLNLTDDSYLECSNIKIPLIHLRTMTKGEPFYCKYGFFPNTERECKVYKYNKKIYLSKPMISKKRFIKYIISNEFYIKHSKDKKIIYYINNILIPRLEDNNIVSILINSMINDKIEESCYLLYYSYMKIFEYCKYSLYVFKSFDLDMNNISLHKNDTKL
jgi:hypothetical protein